MIREILKLETWSLFGIKFETTINLNLRILKKTDSIQGGEKRSRHKIAF